MVILGLERGLNIGCLSYAATMDRGSPSPQSYETFDITTPQIPGLDLNKRPRVCIGASQVYFDEESGKMCFLSMDSFLGQHDAGLFVLDFV